MRYNRIKANDVANGLGVNVSLYTQGCPHHCKGCFNEETWDFNSGKQWTSDDEKNILELLNKNNVSRNLSILGGEPLCEQNIDQVCELCKKVKDIYPEKMIYLWTGYSIDVDNFTNKQKEILKYIDVLIDGPFILDKRNLKLRLRGSENQRVIDIKKTLKEKKIVYFFEDESI